jgi:hypothetical protein
MPLAGSRAGSPRGVEGATPLLPPFLGNERLLCYRAAVGTKRRALLRVAALAVTALGALVGTASCASTEFTPEPQAQPNDRTSGAVPAGAIGVCKRDGTKRPPLVSEALWENTKPCTARTPPKHIRLGYSDKDDPEADKQIEQILAALRDAPKEEGGNNKFVTMLRGVRQRALENPTLRDRVSRDTTSAGACDFTYLLNTMGKAREKIERDQCTAEVFDAKEKKEVCLFDAAKPEGLWLTSGWACLMNTRALGSDQSCHRLCAYDDYCARQVGCAGTDVELLLCAMGICLPEQTVSY